VTSEPVFVNQDYVHPTEFLDVGICGRIKEEDLLASVRARLVLSDKRRGVVAACFRRAGSPYLREVVLRTAKRRPALRHP